MPEFVPLRRWLQVASRWDAEDHRDGLGCPPGRTHGCSVRSRLSERGGTLPTMSFRSQRRGLPLVRLHTTASSAAESMPLADRERIACGRLPASDR